jgi:polyferredoxin
MIVGMIEWMREHWHQFKASKPGHRFQDSYHRRRKSGQNLLSFRRIFNITLGSTLVVFSTFFGWVPGPGLLTFFIGLALIAGELLPVARFLDWAEVRLRKLARRARDIWTRSHIVVKVLIVLAILAFVAALGYGAYYLLFVR